MYNVKQDGLADLRYRIGMDQRLAHLRRPDIIHYVPGDGNVNAPVMVIGEAPGVEENEAQKPFVGACGKLLDEVLKQANVDRETDLYITNVLKYRPPNNRKPNMSEKLVAMEYIAQEIDVIQPRGLVLLGSTAFTLFYPTYKISNYEGRVIGRKGRLVFPCFHPGAVVRDLHKKKNIIAVFQQVRDRCIRQE